MAVYVSTGAFQVRDLDAIATQAVALGIRRLELSSDVAPCADLESTLETLRRAGIDLLVHNYFPAPAQPFVLNLGATEPGTLARSRAHVRRCLDLTARLGGAYYSVHSAFQLAIPPHLLGRPKDQAGLAAELPPRDRVRGVFIESLRELVAHARALGIGLLVENNGVSASYLALRAHNPFLMVEPDEIEAVLAEVDGLGLLLDVAHLRIAATALGFDAGRALARLAPLAGAFHLSDNDGIEDQNTPFAEDSWFWPHLRGLPPRDAVVEVYNLTPDLIRAQRDLAERMLGGQGTPA